MKRFLAYLITLCVLLTVVGSLPVSAEETYWYDYAETITQKMGTITFNGSQATFACDVPSDKGGSLGIKIPLTLPNKEVNVEWKMRMEGAWTTRETMVIYTGTHRAYIGYRVNGITCQDAKGTATVIPCTTGNTMNQFAVQIDKDGVADFYCNGKSIMKDWQLPTNSAAAQISVGNYGGTGGVLSKFTIQDVKWTIPEAPVTTTSSGDPPSLTTPPEEVFYDFTEEEDVSEWRITKPDKVWIDTQEEKLVLDTNAGSAGTFLRVSFADDFIIEQQVRFRSFSDKFYYKVYYPGGMFAVDIREQRIHTEEVSGDILPVGTLLDQENPDEWHNMKFVSYGGKKYVKAYIDGELVGDFPTQPSTRAYYHIQIGATEMDASHATFEFDWIRYTPVWAGDAALAAPLYGDEYLEGEPINLKANLAEGITADKVDYKLNGVVVATGTRENNYNAVLTGLPAGAYTMVASCNGKDSTPAEFDVRPARDGSIETAWVGDGKASASLAFYDELPSVKSVEYLVNGASVGSSNQAPFKVEFPAKKSEGTGIVALCKNAEGAVVEKLGGILSPDLNSGKTTHYANEISYDVAENGEVVVSNGVFQLNLNHTADKLTYQTNEGEKSVAAGNGSYKVLTDGPFADVYYEGKLSASFRMPMTKLAETTTKGVKNFSISIPEERQSYLAKEKVTEQSTIYAVPGLNDKYYYNLDFVASPEDEAKLVVNDSIFSANIELRGGKVYAKTAQSLDSAPYEAELCDIPKGENHFRLATELGMSNLYINGKVAGSFRNVRAVGEASLGVDVTKGKLSYLSVNDYEDIYLYEDDFTGGGVYDSNDYWYYNSAMTGYVDYTTGELALLAKDKTNAIAEMTAYTGKTAFGADVTISKGGEKAGFWMMLNHATDGTYSKAGYNFETKEFEIVDRRESDSSITKVSVPYELETGKSYRMELKTEKQANGAVEGDKKVTLYLDGVPVISKDTLDIAGKIGFMATDCSAYVKNFAYRGDAKPMLDVRDPMGRGVGSLPGTNTTGAFQVDGKIYSVNAGAGAYTTNYGKTWTSIAQKDFSDPSPKWSSHMLKLNTGELLSLSKNEGSRAWGQDYYDDAGNKKYQLQFWLNEDGKGADWIPGQMIYGEGPEDGYRGYGNTVGALSQAPDGADGTPGRVFFAEDHEITSENVGDIHLWASDDKGLTWTEKIHIKFEDQGYSCMQETQPVATEKWVRLYYRNDKGMIRYFESLDNGETWNLESKSTPLFNALNCFDIYVDRYYDEDGMMHEDMYIAWSHDSQNMGARYQFLRTNFSLAKSTDYGESWEYLGTTHRNSAMYTSMMNMGINLFDGYLLTNASSTTSTTVANAGKNRMTMTPVAKQVPTMRIQKTQPLYTSQVEMFSAIRDHKVDRSLMFSGESGMALLRGMHIENAATENAIAANYAASFVGAKAEVSGNKVTLKLGMAEETFDATVKDGICYIPADVFASRFGMNLLELDGVSVITPYDAFTWRGTDAAENALNLFAKVN